MMLKNLTPKFRYRAFQFVFFAAALNFLLPALSYMIAPSLAVQTMDDVNRLLGGPSWPVEQGQLWHMLAVGNVMTLGVLCAVIGLDVIRGFALLPALVFLKSFSALYSLGLAISVDGLVAFFAVFALDGSTAVALAVFGTVGYRAAHQLKQREQPLPLWSYLLVRPRRVQLQLAHIEEQTGEGAPTLWQMMHWSAHMWWRVIFNLDTVGSGGGSPVRSTLRARLLAHKTLRFFPLLVERAIAPLDMSGLTCSRQRISRHLCGAHHDGYEFSFDLEMLAFFPGALEELRETVDAIIAGRDPRAEWLRDLCVYTGYHERLLEGIDLAIAGKLPQSDSPDFSFHAMLAWARTRPVSPRAAGVTADPAVTTTTHSCGA